MRGSLLGHGFAGVWSQHFSEIQYPETDLSQPRTANIDNIWARFYTGTVTGPTMGSIQDYNTILKQSTANPNLLAPTLVMRAFAFQTLTDMYGDIPLTEAGRAEEFLTPKYDAQAVVYDSIFAMYTRAVTITNPSEDVTSPNFARMGDADPVYGGLTAAQEAAKWVKAANSLRARAALRISQTGADPVKAKAQLTAALAGPVFVSNADNAVMAWPGGTLGNPLCLNWANAGCGGTRDDQRVSARLVDTLKVNDDPRLAAFADPTPNSLKATASTCDIPYRGYPNGQDAIKDVNSCTKELFKLSDYSRPNISIRSPQSESLIMTYSELMFIKAEAAERSLVGTPAQAGAFYLEAIRASLQQWGVDPADITAYLGRAQVAYKGGAAGLQQIAYEKWVALYNQETEAWAEQRRLDYPVMKVGPNVVTTTIPTRIPYPTTEQSLNATNLNAAIASQGGANGTSLTGKVWWDKP